MSTSPSEEVPLNQALSPLQLPIRERDRAAGVAAARKALNQLGVSESDHSAWLEFEREEWAISARPSKELQQVVREFVGAGADLASGRVAGAYFSVHKKLASEPTSSHATATALLSCALSVCSWAADDLMTASRVAEQLSASTDRPTSWRSARLMLKGFDVAPEISAAQFAAVRAKDQDSEPTIFADADDDGAARIVAEYGGSLGCSAEALLGDLRRIFPADQDAFMPYVQILHWQLLIAEHFDHVMQNAYEFAPRGVDGVEFFSTYPPELLTAGGNPILNNTKSSDSIDSAWAAPKKGAQREAAPGLSGILGQLDQLAFATRRSLAQVLRCYIERYIRVATPEPSSFPEKISAEQFKSLLTRVGEGPTNTRGIIEQRCVDVLCAASHPPPVWISRGLGDSVTTSNLSAGKLGDCDFQDNLQRKVIAYEPHAGDLSGMYLSQHAATLKTVMERRKRDWELNFAAAQPDTEEWSVEVVFVAHRIAGAEAELGEADVAGVKTNVSAETFAAFFDRLSSHSTVTEALIRDLLLAPLASRYTPQAVREKFKQLLQ